MSVAIVTPWFNHPELWPDYERAIIAGEPDELIIIDNASTPPLDFGTRTLRVTENLGFAGGCNTGLHLAKADKVVFLNNDIELVRPGWLQQLTMFIEPGVLVGAQLRTDRHAIVDDVEFPYLDGWCVGGMRQDLIDLGGFDETLQEPAYYSDNLLSLEARARGMTLVEAPAVGLRHKLNQTAHRDDPIVRAATLANQARYQARARELMVPAQ